jgi:hypothetical protein
MSIGYEFRTLLCAAVGISKKCVLCAVCGVCVNMLKSDSSAECVCCTKLVGTGLLRLWCDSVLVFVHLVAFDFLSEKYYYVWHAVVIYVYDG